MIDIKIIKASSSLFDAVKYIRISVFVEEQGINALDEFDKFDQVDSNCEYVLLFDNNEPVATSRICRYDNCFKIGRIAVLKPFRGKHYGAIVVKQAIDAAFENGAKSVFVDAQNYAVPFYEKIGFKVCGEQIYDRGLPHIPMVIAKGEYNAKEKE